MSGPVRLLPTTRREMSERGWDELDILFVSGDAYVDHPAFGVPLLARLLEVEGYRVGIIAQPDWNDPEAFRIMGRPRLFAAVSAGAMDSMVNHYTAAKKRRNDDAYTPGGVSGLRPNRATIAYTAALKNAFRHLPVVIGGIEASLRRLAHYDYWENSVRRSILVDSKADLLLYGMAETALLEVARRTAAGESPSAIDNLRGSARLLSSAPDDALILPSYTAVAADKTAFAEAYLLAERENCTAGRRLAQEYDRRWLVVEPPPLPLSTPDLDRIYALPFTRKAHPACTAEIPALIQIATSITTHRGCFGGCGFCALGLHQGKAIQSRSAVSILAEIDRIASDPGFRGTVSDLGGPSANMYGFVCNAPGRGTSCRRGSCLWPQRCPMLLGDETLLTALLEQAAARPRVKHLFVASGLRFDLFAGQPGYLRRVIRQHVSGLLKVAPEAFDPESLRYMRKPDKKSFLAFLETFRTQSAACGKRQYVVPYLMAGHPGTTLAATIETALLLKRLNLKVEQVQEFTPTPGTLATCIYHTGIDPESGKPVYVARSADERSMQKALLLWHRPESRDLIRRALVQEKRLDLIKELAGESRSKEQAGEGSRGCGARPERRPRR